MEENLRHVDIFTDGACSGNPGPGGYGVILRYGAHEKELSGGDASTTNNRMELMGVIAGLSELKERCDVTLYTDSQYVANGITKGWALGWRRRGWKKSDNSPVQNPDLWQRVLDLLEYHRVEIVWVRGHNGHAENERCDKLAVAFSRSLK